MIGCGYFGWLDWSADETAGVPQGTRGDFRRVPFDDVAALEAAVAAADSQLAAIVIEPVIERMPSPAWINRARDLATQTGAALVFDEIKTGFRLKTGGYQAFADVVPDLAAFGKAMANGFPLAAVVGHRDLMDAARKTWISSTLASESSALAAAGAVLVVARQRRCVRVALVDRRRHETRRGRARSKPVGCRESRRRSRPDVDRCGSIGRSASDGFWSWAPPAACSSSAARTTIAALAHDDERCGTSSAARATRWSRFETRRRRPRG